MHNDLNNLLATEFENNWLLLIKNRLLSIQLKIMIRYTFKYDGI